MLAAYGAGIFPMAAARRDPALHWVDPERRGIVPLDGFHISRSLRRTLLRADYRVSTDTAFAAVVTACADRPETWINAPLVALYHRLHAMGHGHSIEVWQEDQLAGGVFGLTLGAAFFGESMVSPRRDGSKIALAWLVERLRRGGFRLFDTQFITAHLASLGAVEIPRARYRMLLAQAIAAPADFAAPGPSTPQEVVQRSTQTS